MAGADGGDAGELTCHQSDDKFEAEKRQEGRTDLATSGQSDQKLETRKRLALPYRTVNRSFDSEAAAVGWVVSNQLARRNLKPDEVAYLRGKEHRAEKRQGERTDITSRNSCGKSEATAERLARKYGVSARTIENDAAFARDVDAIAEVIPEAKEQILRGPARTPRTVVKEAAKQAEPEEVRRVLNQSRAACSIRLDSTGSTLGSKPPPSWHLRRPRFGRPDLAGPTTGHLLRSDPFDRVHYRAPARLGPSRAGRLQGTCSTHADSTGSTTGHLLRSARLRRADYGAPARLAAIRADRLRAGCSTRAGRALAHYPPAERYADIAADLGITVATAKKYCADARQDEKRDQQERAWDLWLDCHSQADIAKAVGSKQPTVNGWISKTEQRSEFASPPESRQHFDVWAFASEAAAVGWVVSNQLARRNLKPDEVAYLRGKEYQAEKRQGERTDLATSGQSDQKLETRERLGKDSPPVTSRVDDVVPAQGPQVAGPPVRLDALPSRR